MPRQLKTTFGGLVKAGREALGWTQAEMAAQLGHPISTLQHWEQGVSRPRSRFIREAILRVLHQFLEQSKQQPKRSAK